MKVTTLGVNRSRTLARCAIAIACGVTLIAADLVAIAGSPNARARHSSASTPLDEPTTIPPEQLDALVAPIALFPDNLLSQTLVAATYPLELIQLSNGWRSIPISQRTKRSWLRR